MICLRSNCETLTARQYSRHCIVKHEKCNRGLVTISPFPSHGSDMPPNFHATVTSHFSPLQRRLIDSIDVGSAIPSSPSPISNVAVFARSPKSQIQSVTCEFGTWIYSILFWLYILLLPTLWSCKYNIFQTIVFLKYFSYGLRTIADVEMKKLSCYNALGKPKKNSAHSFTCHFNVRGYTY